MTIHLFLALGLASLLSLPVISAFSTTTEYFILSDEDDNGYTGNLSFQTTNATMQEIMSSIVNVYVLYDFTISELNLTLLVDGQSCTPASYHFGVSVNAQTEVRFDCTNIIDDIGDYEIQIIADTAPSKDYEVLISSVGISYDYSDGAIDNLLYFLNNLWDKITGIETTINATYDYATINLTNYALENFNIVNDTNYYLKTNTTLQLDTIQETVQKPQMFLISR